MLAKISPWGLTALALATLGLLGASVLHVRGVTIALSALGLALVLPGIWACRRGCQVSHWIWLLLGGGLSAIVLALALFHPGILHRSWILENHVVQEDPNQQMLVPVEIPFDSGRPLANSEWVDAGREGIRQQDLFVRLETVKIGQLPDKGAASFLMVQFRLSQIRPDKKASFKGFAPDKFAPVLTDAGGKAYKFLFHRARKPFPSKFDVTLNVDHWLVYELPAGTTAAPKIESLKLEVPAAAWGRQGVCRFLVKEIEIDETPDVPKLIAHYKGVLAKLNRPPDLALGRKTFVKQCMECHTLFGLGNKIGPELTDLKFPDGRRKRDDRDFLVTNIVDPSAEIAKEFQPWLVVTHSGQVFSGIIKEQNADVVTIQTATKKVELKIDDIAERKESKVSIMPTELLKPLDEHEVRSLFAYLSGPAQTPLLASHENFGHFFMGDDLNYWKNLGGLWKVDKGDVIAPPPQDGKRSFLISDLLLAEDFRVALKIQPGKAGRAAVLIQDEDSLEFSPVGPRVEVAAGEALLLVDRKGGRHPTTGSSGGTVLADTWNTLEIFLKGNGLQIRLNGKDVLAWEDPQEPGRRCVTLEVPATNSPAGSQEIRFRNLDLLLLTPNRRNP
jgi:putative heme-binding domain-containing protein